MSLINQVLKDLEQRHAAEVRGVARAVRPLPEDAPRRGLWIVLALVAAMSVAGTAWWYLSPALARNTQLGELTPTRVAPAAASPSVPRVEVSTPSSVVPAPDMSAQGLGTPAPVPDQRTSAHPPVVTQTALATPEISGLPRAPPPAALGFPEARVAARRPVLPPVAQHARALDEAAAASETAQELQPEDRKPVARASRKTDPKVSGPNTPVDVEGTGAPATEDPRTPPPAANIQKQVRPPTERERVETEFRRGMAALGAGDATEAEDKLRAALAIDPTVDKARQALLGLYIERGRREDAEQLLEDRLRVDRRPAGFALALARLQLERGANSDALATLQRSLPSGEASADYQAMLANALGRLGQHKQAAERFEMAARLSPRNPVWLMGLGVELRADNRSSEARAAFQRARELGGLNPQLANFVDRQISELK
jgi:MSHA biogenesis protein MshN